MSKKGLAVLLSVTLLLGGITLSGCGQQTPPPQSLTLATTTSTQDSGLLGVLIPAFEQKYNYKVKVVAVGTGQALETASRGDADVVLVHSRPAEDKFVADGFGIDRRDVMYNDFVIVGPENDPAKIKGMKSGVDAFKQIANAQATFISRADDSGTHKKELEIWKKAKMTPQGDWYVKAGVGMGEALQMADEKGAYLLSDRGTYLAWRDKLKLVILVEGDSSLLNPYGVIAVNPAKNPNVNYEGAKKFIEFITSPEGQKIIGEFGKDKYGQALFVPTAVQQ